MDLLIIRIVRHAGTRILVLAASFTLISFQAALAQISPGDLAKAHANLEGLDNCTKCHTLGKAISNDKCLACHQEIRTRILEHRGYHAGVQQKPCAECHNDHHGRDFQLVRFDTRTFDHASVGYRLEGKHASLACESCHTRKNIKAADVLKDQVLLGGQTYLGLGRECLDCHENTHRGQLPAQCLSCHTMGGWKPASGFSHDQAKYKLTGKHLQVSCASCHKPFSDHDRTVKYVGLQFDRCSSCHGDPHQGRFRQPCESCHTTGGWNEGEARKFDHSATKFPLRGRHASVTCEACHVPVRGAGGTLTQVFAIKHFQHCADCHADAHKGEFANRKQGGACEECHTEQGFRQSLFIHATARYALEGKHKSVACKACHGETTSNIKGERLPPSYRVSDFQHCMDCHKDAHGGQFLHRGDRGACESCHTVDGFVPARYTSEAHRASGFALAGAHAAVGCEECHRAKMVRAPSTRQFRWAKTPTCQSCHKDVHRGQFARIMENGCETCHSVASWTSVRFSHDSTRFPLRGKHVDVPCDGCHKVIDKGTPEQRVQYAGTPRRCVDCHSDSRVTTSVSEGSD